MSSSRMAVADVCACTGCANIPAEAEPVEVIRMATDDVCEHYMLVLVRWQGRKRAVPLSQLAAVNPDNQLMRPSTTGTIGWRRTALSDLRTATERTPRHCELLSENLAKAAKEARTLAEAHAEMAKK